MPEQKTVVVTIKVTGTKDLVKELIRNLEAFRDGYLNHCSETMEISVVPGSVHDVAVEAGVDIETAMKKLKALASLLKPEPKDSVEKDTIEV